MAGWDHYLGIYVVDAGGVRDGGPGDLEVDKMIRGKAVAVWFGMLAQT